MENRAHALAAGLFVIFLSLAGGLALWWLSNERQETRRYELVTEGSLTGLNEQAQVRYRGIRAGKVEAIGIDPADPRHLVVRISLRKDLPVTRGTRASLAYQGLTGIAFVQLTDRGEDPAPLAPGPSGLPRLSLQPGLMEQFGDSGMEALRKLQNVAEQLGKVLNEGNVARITRTLEQLEGAAEGVRRTAEEAPRVLASARAALSPENMAHLTRALAQLDAASQEVAPAVRELRNLAVRLQTTSERVDRLAASAAHNVTQGTLPRVDALLNELTETSRRMNHLLEEIEASPQMLILGRGGVAPGPGEAGHAGARKD